MYNISLAHIILSRPMKKKLFDDQEKIERARSDGYWKGYDDSMSYYDDFSFETTTDSGSSSSQSGSSSSSSSSGSNSP